MAKEADGSARVGASTSDITPPMVQAGARGLQTITAADTAWMSPGNPLQAIVPNTAGRQYDFPVAANLVLTPRAGEAVSFGDLRGLADAYYLVRMAIETRKDQLVKLKWVIKPTDSKKKPDARCDDLTAFFKSPDKRHDWQEWIRMLVEDMMVIDAPTVYFHPNLGNSPYAFEIIDGATIKVLLDQYGRAPLPPDPAYQQNMKGVPTVNYTTDEMIYKPRNPRSWKAYGFSPVEQIIMIVNVGLRRTLSQLQFYTEGNIPEALISTPNTWNPDQVILYQKYWDSLLEGNTAARRHAKFVPGGMTIHETKSESLTDAFDEWLARVVMYCFSLPPSAFTKQTNRATAETAKAQAEEEGLVPLMLWIEDLVNLLIRKYWKITDLEFAWEDEKSIDPLVQAQIDQIYLSTEDADGNTVLDANEVRESLGLEAKDFDALALERAKKNPANDPATGAPLQPIPPIEPKPAGETAPAADPKDAPEKASANHGLKKKTYAKMSATNVKRAKKLAGVLTKHFRSIKPDVIDQICAAYDKSAKVEKNFTQERRWLEAGNWVIAKGTADDITQNIDLGFAAILNVTAKQLTPAAREGVDDALDRLTQYDISVDEKEIAQGVGDYNAAEMVTNIDPTTRDMLATDIDEAYKQGLSTDELAGILQDNYAFSDARADTIARTEIAKADMSGSMKTYRESGVVTGKKWLLAEEPCPICEENENDGIIDIDEDFSSGDDAAPAHPNCECDVAPVVGDSTEDDEDETTTEE